MNLAHNDKPILSNNIKWDILCTTAHAIKAMLDAEAEINIVDEYGEPVASDGECLDMILDSNVIVFNALTRIFSILTETKED